MKTVGDFYNAGLEFIVGDECDGSNGELFSKNWVKYSNENDADFVNCTPTKFAWRTNTGKKPSFEGLIDIELDGESVYEREHSSSYWVGGSTDQSVIKWRPALNQPAIQTETPEEKEALETITESKPIFTQAMADAGEKVKAGMLFATAAGNQEALMVSDKSVVFEVDGYLRVEIHEFIHPIKTEREKAIDEMIQLDCWATDMEFCEELYNANYRKLTPSQAKAYDDKTEYFGEEYK